VKNSEYWIGGNGKKLRIEIGVGWAKRGAVNKGNETDSLIVSSKL